MCGGGVLEMEKGLVRTLGSDSALAGEALTVTNGLQGPEGRSGLTGVCVCVCWRVEVH